jgi:hypothetical protein
MTTDTQINPFVDRRLPGPSESFRSWTCLLWSREEWGDPGDGADSHAGGTADTHVWIIFRPGFLIFHIGGLENVVATFRLRYFTQAKACGYYSWFNIIFYNLQSDRNVPRKPRRVGGVKGHNINDITLPGSPGLWPGSFKS